MSTVKNITTSNKSTKKDTEHLKVFAKYRHFHDFFNKTGELVNFSHEIQAELLEAYRIEFDPYYNYQRHCPACVCEFLTFIYRQYDSRY